MTDACETCRFFSPDEQANGQAIGDCRRNPPATFMIAIPRGPTAITRPGAVQSMNMEIKFPAAWPGVEGKHWCGEYKRQVAGAGKEVPKKLTVLDAVVNGPGQLAHMEKTDS